MCVWIENQESCIEDQECASRIKNRVWRTKNSVPRIENCISRIKDQGSHFDTEFCPLWLSILPRCTVWLCKTTI